jgi:DNA-binding transcriptional ArsR family regulator
MSTGEVSKDNARNEVFSALSDIAQAMSAPVRLRIIQFLSNRPSGVEELSDRVGESIANTSQHLQKLKKAGMVIDSRDGVQKTYSIKSPSVIDALLQFQKVASQLIPHIQTAEETLCPSELKPTVSLETILKEVREKRAVLIDVRDKEDFGASPASMAIFFPRENIKKHLSLLPKQKTIYAFCRGRYCSLANQVVRDLRKHGYSAYRLAEISYEIEKTLSEMEG